MSKTEHTSENQEQGNSSLGVVSGSYCLAKHEDGRVGKWYFKHKQIGEIIPVCFDDDMMPTYVHKSKLGWGNP